MQLGAFSVSLAVKDITKSKQFYMKLGFEIVGGVEEQNWLILRNGDHTIGLFQDMFENNIMTFNPGWDKSNQNLDKFTDIRDIQNKLEESGMEFQMKVKEGSEGPGSFIINDPDGNTILFDQHR